VREIKPRRNVHDQFVQMITEEIEYEGISVIIPRRECVQTQLRKAKAKKKGGK
jgi:indolepyruvate ferredoxin oxidoreductase alpha subunit